MLSLDANRTRLLATVLHEASVAADSTPFGIVFPRRNHSSAGSSSASTVGTAVARFVDPASPSQQQQPDLAAEVAQLSRELNEQQSGLAAERQRCAELKTNAAAAKLEADALHAAVKQSLEVKQQYDATLAARLKQLREDAADMRANLDAMKKLSKKGYTSGESISLVPGAAPAGPLARRQQQKGGGGGAKK